MTHFDTHCLENNCHGIKSTSTDLCYQFDRYSFLSVKDFFSSFPVISFKVKGGGEIKVLASEYFYVKYTTLDKFTYCLDADRENRSDILMGTTFMSQSNYIFDPFSS